MGTLQLLPAAKLVPYAELYAACPTMIGCWPDSKTPVPLALWLKALRSFVRLNAGAGVPAIFTCMMVRVFGPYPGRIAGAPFGHQVRSAGVVVIARHPGGERRRGVVVEDQRLAGELREVDDDVGALGRSQQQRVQVHVPDVEAGRVRDPGGGLLAVHDHRGRQEAALGADLDPVGTCRSPAPWNRGREDDRVGLRRRQLEGVQRDLGRADDLAPCCSGRCWPWWDRPRTTGS